LTYAIVYYVNGIHTIAPECEEAQAKKEQLMENRTIPTPVNATLEEAAAYLKVAKRTIQGYQERGLLKPVYFGKLRRFRWEEIRRLEKTGIQ
jgi:excisionase family DNA binding protein